MRCRAFLAAYGGFCFPHYLFFSVRKEAGKRSPRGAGAASLGGLFRRCWVPRRCRLLLLPTAPSSLPSRLCCGLPFLFRPPIRRPACLVLRGVQVCTPCAGEALKVTLFFRNVLRLLAPVFRRRLFPSAALTRVLARFVRKPHGGLPRPAPLGGVSRRSPCNRRAESMFPLPVREL